MDYHQKIEIWDPSPQTGTFSPGTTPLQGAHVSSQAHVHLILSYNGFYWFWLIPLFLNSLDMWFWVSDLPDTEPGVGGCKSDVCSSHHIHPPNRSYMKYIFHILYSLHLWRILEIGPISKQKMVLDQLWMLYCLDRPYPLHRHCGCTLLLASWGYLCNYLTI